MSDPSVLARGFDSYLSDPVIRKMIQETKRKRLHEMKIKCHLLKDWPHEKKQMVERFIASLPVPSEDRKSFIDLYLRGYSKRKLCDYPIYEREIDRRIDRVLDVIGREVFQDWDFPGLEKYLEIFETTWKRCDRLTHYLTHFSKNIHRA